VNSIRKSVVSRTEPMNIPHTINIGSDLVLEIGLEYIVKTSRKFYSFV